ncbi:hypothetical protein EG359_08800 [Chryseobacterium joostei]|uniref:Uncharacterized protein n=1 Tax=Chryseobacterium joostei TaxID=112234 RepID=A0A1N7I374_9FLAO|nr:hypothetical protein [Chryseobacterium joostei]AZA99705.1 hypothetical protein EG359_08800 [Chryseobacterium joostei]SIS31513.1 hypothetical protein SAMN05421768_102408 [Chryseobacterium joostei]
MILGVYWYFKFPENLYHFKFFRFFEGYGGHADNDAELAARVQVSNIENLIRKLEELKLCFKRTYLSLAINENQLIISIGDHQLFDYHFQFAAEIEDLLIQENAKLLDSSVPFKAQLNKSYQPEKEVFENIEHRFIQIVGSELKKNNAENLSIRIDCNLPLADKKDFINHLIPICREENINVFYYKDHDFNNHCNLMLFFSNGRQSKDAIQAVHVNSFGNKIRQLSEKYPLHFGHFGGLNHYPQNEPHIELMVDEEYILSKK